MRITVIPITESNAAKQLSREPPRSVDVVSTRSNPLGYEPIWVHQTAMIRGNLLSRRAAGQMTAPMYRKHMQLMATEVTDDLLFPMMGISLLASQSPESLNSAERSTETCGE